MVAFIPDATESKAWKISHDSVQVIEAENTLIRKIIKSKHGEWPEKSPGVLRVELDGAVQGYRTEAQIEDGEETAGSTVTRGADSIDLVNFGRRVFGRTNFEHHALRAASNFLEDPWIRSAKSRIA